MTSTDDDIPDANAFLAAIDEPPLTFEQTALFTDVKALMKQAIIDKTRTIRFFVGDRPKLHRDLAQGYFEARHYRVDIDPGGHMTIEAVPAEPPPPDPPPEPAPQPEPPPAPAGDTPPS